MRIAICIGTFRRLDLLQELLVGVSQLTFRRTTTPEIEVIIVDNDPLGSARDICQSGDFRFPRKYVIEPRRGIAHVRNRAVREAGVVDFLAFIDDDEVPSAEWLEWLLWTHSEYKAEIVAGPVKPNFPAGVPEWIKKGGFFDRSGYQTGTFLEIWCTANALVSTAVIASISGFDERFQLTGGEDTDFFRRARRAGFKIVWSQEAVVSETISRDRANLRWILHRGFQSGNSWVLCEESLDARLQVRFSRFIKGSVHLLTGTASALISLFFSRAATAKSLRKAWLGVGMLAGLFGHQYLAYKSAGTAPMKPLARVGDGRSG
jgi:GT2 family glycosyltransferase